MTPEKVELVLYKPEYLEVLKTFDLPKEQKQFTALPTDMLADLSEGQHPIIIVNNNEPVGFFLLNQTARVKEYTDNPYAMLLTALSINHSQQGSGFGEKGMKKLKSFVNENFPNCNEIILAVNCRNIPAQRLYEKVQFKDTGRRKLGPIGEQIIMRCDV